MIIRVEYIKEMLFQLKNGSISREEASNWAIKFREAYDNKRLIFSPLSKENDIWDALQFIELFSEKIEPETYLYSNIDLEEYIKQKGWL